jgi:hypothetical protein
MYFQTNIKTGAVFRGQVKMAFSADPSAITQPYWVDQFQNNLLSEAYGLYLPL